MPTPRLHHPRQNALLSPAMGRPENVVRAVTSGQNLQESILEPADLWRMYLQHHASLHCNTLPSLCYTLFVHVLPYLLRGHRRKGDQTPSLVLITAHQPFLLIQGKSLGELLYAAIVDDQACPSAYSIRPEPSPPPTPSKAPYLLRVHCSPDTIFVSPSTVTVTAEVYCN